MTDELIKYLPHKDPILMINKVLEASELQCIALSIINPGNPFLDENNVLASPALIEIMAQTAALCIVYPKENKEEPIIGFLTGAEDLDFYQSVALHDEIRIIAELDTKLLQYYIFNCQVFKQFEPIAKGKIKIFENDESMESFVKD